MTKVFAHFFPLQRTNEKQTLHLISCCFYDVNIRAQMRYGKIDRPQMQTHCRCRTNGNEKKYIF